MELKSLSDHAFILNVLYFACSWYVCLRHLILAMLLNLRKATSCGNVALTQMAVKVR